MIIKHPIPEHILDEATDWLVLLHSGEMTESQFQQFEQWKAQNQTHSLAIKQIEKFTNGLSHLPNTFQHENLVQSKKQFNSTLNRNMLLGFSTIILLGFTLYTLPWNEWRAGQHTKVGQIKTLILEDGSKLVLASNSYININFSEKMRKIELINGEIFIQTAKDKQHRPFLVETRNGQLEALGTQFTVRQNNNHKTKINVYQHAVAIHPSATSERKIIHQGQRAVFGDKTISKLIPLKNQQPYWTQHLLVVEQWPLKKVISELYRYKHGTYILDQSIQNTQVSGVFSLDNIQQSLETLAYSNQLELTFYTPYLLNIDKK